MFSSFLRLKFLYTLLKPFSFFPFSFLFKNTLFLKLKFIKRKFFYHFPLKFLSHFSRFQLLFRSNLLPLKDFITPPKILSKKKRFKFHRPKFYKDLPFTRFKLLKTLSITEPPKKISLLVDSFPPTENLFHFPFKSTRPSLFLDNIFSDFILKKLHKKKRPFYNSFPFSKSKKIKRENKSFHKFHNHKPFFRPNLNNNKHNFSSTFNFRFINRDLVPLPKRSLVYTKSVKNKKYTFSTPKSLLCFLKFLIFIFFLNNL
eukprot:TRINITY_DN811_c0_g1_i10.p1 TRINITY_DN811_c0_g1~~TRINITY_DN811_c0_g1_i10.p1  ORF type:complete len:258 (-),score=-7.96 TRINITY_DN811_c0_g1_i10:1023-1796(-)